MAISKFGKLLPVLLAALLASGSALAGKPEWAGGGRGGNEDHQAGGSGGGGKHGGKGEHQGGHGGGGQDGGAQYRGGDGRVEVRVGAYFDDRQREAARSYYSQHYGGGKSCPPGLAKKRNGCLPPGIARQWVPGQRLPTGVAVYPVAPAVLVQLPPPPIGHEYVRVAADILLIAAGTHIVVDGMSDLLRH